MAGPGGCRLLTACTSAKYHEASKHGVKSGLGWFTSKRLLVRTRNACWWNGLRVHINAAQKNIATHLAQAFLLLFVFM